MESIAALLTAPFSSLMRRSHCQLGAKPVMVPKRTSLAIPYTIIRFLPYLSMREPIRGLMTAKATMMLLVKRPTLATEAPGRSWGRS